MLVYPWGGSSKEEDFHISTCIKEGSVANLNSTSDQAQIGMSGVRIKIRMGVVSNYQNNIIPELIFDEENKCVVFIWW